MADSFDRERILGYLFDPKVSDILAELEDGGKDSAYLSEKLHMTPAQIRAELSYLIECGFVAETGDDPAVYTADGERLARVMENDENFESAIDGMTKLDSFLN